MVESSARRSAGSHLGPTRASAIACVNGRPSVAHERVGEGAAAAPLQRRHAMTDQLQKPGAEQTLMREMGLTPQTIERRRRIVGLGPDDTKRIELIKDTVQRNVDE